MRQEPPREACLGEEGTVSASSSDGPASPQGHRAAISSNRKKSEGLVLS